MSEVKRYTPDMQFAKSQLKEDYAGEFCFYRDYAAQLRAGKDGE